MISNALLVTIAVLLAYGFWLMDQLKFIPQCLWSGLALTA